MITLTGESVWPRGSEHGDAGVPSLMSIGAGLGRMPRFAGQTQRLYTVLAHTFVVAELVEPAYRVYALLHDAAEAIVGDVPTTWKTAEARAHEDDLLERITHDLDLPWPWPHAAQAAVKKADALALAAEAHVLGHAEAAKWWPDVDPNAEALTQRLAGMVRVYLDRRAAGIAYTNAIAEHVAIVRPREVNHA